MKSSRKNILLNLILNLIDPIGKSKLIKNNKLKNNSKKLPKKKYLNFANLFIIDNFFEISVAILSFYLSKSDGFVNEKIFINSYGDLNKKERI